MEPPPEDLETQRPYSPAVGMAVKGRYPQYFPNILRAVEDVLDSDWIAPDRPVSLEQQVLTHAGVGRRRVGWLGGMRKGVFCVFFDEVEKNVDSCSSLPPPGMLSNAEYAERAEREVRAKVKELNELGQDVKEKLGKCWTEVRMVEEDML